MAVGLAALAGLVPAFSSAAGGAAAGSGLLAKLIAGGSAIGSSALGLTGSLLGSASSAEEARKLRKQQWKIWQEQKDLALNAHKYEVDDLRNAGLNPILSATGGSGLSVPSGSVTAQSPGLNFSGMGDPILKAFEIYSGFQRMEMMEKQIEGVSSANEGKRLENEARELNNHINSVSAQYEINKRAYNSKIAAAKLRESEANAKIASEDALYRGSVEGRNLHSAKQFQLAYPRNGSVGALFNIGGSAIERIFNLIEQKKKQQYGPEVWNNNWKEIRR